MKAEDLLKFKKRHKILIENLLNRNNIIEEKIDELVYKSGLLKKIKSVRQIPSWLRILKLYFRS